MRGKDIIYCPYTDEDIPVQESSPEHIIPLSLGGSNQFTLPVASLSNSSIGSEIDGSLANDFFVKLRRDEYSVAGHSGKTGGYVFKKASDVQTGEPLRVTMSRREGFQVWSPKKQRDLTGLGKHVSIEGRLQADIAMRFVAKVALSSGYLVYGNLFRSSVAHGELRAIMNLRPEDIDAAVLEKMKVRVDDRFRQPETANDQAIRAVCTSINPISTVVLIPDSTSFRVAVGILGDYMGMISVPADTKNFPNAGEMAMGHVVILRQRICAPISLLGLFQRIIGPAT